MRCNIINAKNTALPKRALKMVKWSLISLALLFLTVVMIIPIVFIFIEAFSQGIPAYWEAWIQADTLAAIQLSLVAIVSAVCLNGIFGIAAAWFLTKYNIKGKNTIISLLELPFSISPVISGMLIILTFGNHSIIGSALEKIGIQVMFTPIAIILATTFITLPFTARELISLMQTQGSEEEEAAYLLGASGWQLFRKITLPNILPALLYGCLLTAARALGEFGAVSAVSGHIRGYTNTLPLHIEVLYNDYEFTQAFAIATLMMSFALISIIVRYTLDHRKK